MRPNRSLPIFFTAVLVAVAVAAACGGAPGAKGNKGDPGAPGLDGQNGNDGNDGTPGQDGAPGQNGQDGVGGGGETQILRLTGVDVNGVADDKQVVVDFAGTVSDALLQGQSITVSFSQRSAPQLVASVVGVGCDSLGDPVDQTCFTTVNGLRVLDLENDDPADGFLSPGASFHLRFDRAMQLTTRDDIDNWVSGVIGINEGFRVTETVPGIEYELTWQLADALPIAAFNANGDDIGTSLVMPPFTVRDENGDGNALIVLELSDGALLAAQNEPKGLAFNANLDVDTAAVLEDGIWQPGDAFTLRFDSAMDPQSTEQAIELRLEEGPFNDVDVIAVGAATFLVIVQGATPVDLTGTAGTFTLVLQPHDVTNAIGITNSTQVITFDITDITVPTLNIINAANADTLQVVLATGVPARLNGGSQDNNFLVQGDTLAWTFSEPMDVASVQAELARVLNLLGNGAGNTLTAAANELTPQLGATRFVYTLKAGEGVVVPAVLTLDTLATTATDVGNAADIAIALADNQVPKATRAAFIVQAQLVPLVQQDTLQVILGATPREDNIIEAGDTLVFQFTKKMDPVTTVDELAARITNGALTGGARRGTFDLNTVKGDIAIANANGLVGNTFIYPLSGDQVFEITAATLSFGALATTVLDDNGLTLAFNQEPSVSDANFDPDLAPTLASIVGVRAANTACGDGLLIATDSVTFTFSEPLDAGSIDTAKAAIVAAFNVAANGTDITAADIGVVGNIAFRVALPAGTTLATDNPRAFTLNPAGILDANGVTAVTLQATLDTVDVLAVTAAFTRNLVDNDGRMVGGDQLALTWSCQMDEAVTLTAVQTAVDTLMGDGTARTTTLNNRTYVVEVLPGRRFDMPAQVTLAVGDVATDLDIVAENDDQPNDGRVTIGGPFNVVFDDLPVADVTLTYVGGTAAGFTGTFTAANALATGTWFLSDVSSGLTRGELELPVVFTDFE